MPSKFFSLSCYCRLNKYQLLVFSPLIMNYLCFCYCWIWQCAYRQASGRNEGEEKGWEIFNNFLKEIIEISLSKKNLKSFLSTSWPILAVRQHKCRSSVELLSIIRLAADDDGKILWCSVKQREKNFQAPPR